MYNKILAKPSNLNCHMKSTPLFVVWCTKEMQCTMSLRLKTKKTVFVSSKRVSLRIGLS